MTVRRVGLVAMAALCLSVAFSPLALAQVPVAAAPAAAGAGQQLTVLVRSGVWLNVGASRWVHGVYVTPVTAPASATTYAPGATVSSRTSQQVYGSGEGIFLNYSGSGRTWGCVGLMNSSELTNTVKWLNPAKNPKMVIKG